MKEENKRMNIICNTLKQHVKWENKALVPFATDYSSFFTVTNNNIKYKGQSRFTMLVFNTMMINMQEYEFTVSFINK